MNFWCMFSYCLHILWECNCTLEVHFFIISWDYCLSHGVHALSNSLSRKLAALLRENVYIWGNLKYNEVYHLTINHLLITLQLVVWVGV